MSLIDRLLGKDSEEDAEEGCCDMRIEEVEDEEN